MTDEEVPQPRLCDAFGHPLGDFFPWDDLPECAGCAVIVARHGQLRKDGMTYLVCHGHTVGAIQSLPARDLNRWYCWFSEPGGPLFTIGRRPTRPLALATVAASHDCTEVEL